MHAAQGIEFGREGCCGRSHHCLQLLDPFLHLLECLLVCDVIYLQTRDTCQCRAANDGASQALLVKKIDDAIFN